VCHAPRELVDTWTGAWYADLQERLGAAEAACWVLSQFARGSGLNGGYGVSDVRRLVELCGEAVLAADARSAEWLLTATRTTTYPGGRVEREYADEAVAQRYGIPYALMLPAGAAWGEEGKALLETLEGRWDEATAQEFRNAYLYQHPDGRIFLRAYGGRWLDAAALQAQPVTGPVNAWREWYDAHPEPQLAGLCALLGVTGYTSPRLLRYPDGRLVARWEGVEHDLAAFTDEQLEAAGREVLRAREQRAAELEARAIGAAAKRAGIEGAAEIALVNAQEELAREEGPGSETVLSRIVCQDATGDRLWKLYSVRWAWGCLGEDGEADEEFRLFADPEEAQKAYERYARR
ncbi:MAG TPA: hypothetical protein VFU47_09875, partial [Armatimonadota bacterium]|nr:hypothetical protein [Armatimonadota bacterium]